MKLPQRLKPLAEGYLNAALKRCATQKLKNSTFSEGVIVAGNAGVICHWQ